MKKYLVVLLSFSFLLNADAQFLKNISLAELNEIDKLNNSSLESSFGFSDDDEIPSSYSLEEYCIVSDQGESSSCTGFAVANGSMTILYNIVNDLTTWNDQFINRFDPYYVYCSLKDDNDLRCISGGGCDCGSRINEALELIETYGCKKLNLYPKLDCSSTLNKNNLRAMSEMTGMYDIDGFVNLFEYEERKDGFYTYVDIEEMKWCLSNLNPITAGISVNAEFSGLSPEKNRYSARLGEMEGRHAVTIVGYDDRKYGGAFRILNSYGDEWGDEGFFWMTYDDFERYGDCAYVILKDDWDSWRDPIASENFYKGFDRNDEMYWEGPVDENYLFHGTGILTTNSYVARASYKNGYAHGWWLVMDYFDQEDPFGGYILFEDGEIIEIDEFGFSSNSVSLEDVTDSFHMNHFKIKDYDLEVGSEDDINIEGINNLSGK